MSFWLGYFVGQSNARGGSAGEGLAGLFLVTMVIGAALVVVGSFLMPLYLSIHLTGLVIGRNTPAFVFFLLPFLIVFLIWPLYLTSLLARRTPAYACLFALVAVNFFITMTSGMPYRSAPDDQAMSNLALISSPVLIAIVLSVRWWLHRNFESEIIYQRHFDLMSRTGGFIPGRFAQDFFNMRQIWGILSIFSILILGFTAFYIYQYNWIRPAAELKSFTSGPNALSVEEALERMENLREFRRANSSEGIWMIFAIISILFMIVGNYIRLEILRRSQVRDDSTSI